MLIKLLDEAVVVVAIACFRSDAVRYLLRDYVNILVLRVIDGLVWHNDESGDDEHNIYRAFPLRGLQAGCELDLCAMLACMQAAMVALAVATTTTAATVARPLRRLRNAHAIEPACTKLHEESEILQT